MVVEVVEQSPILSEALLQPLAVSGAELLHSLLRRTASDHGLQSYLGQLQSTRVSRVINEYSRGSPWPPP